MAYFQTGNIKHDKYGIEERDIIKYGRNKAESLLCLWQN